MHAHGLDGVRSGRNGEVRLGGGFAGRHAAPVPPAALHFRPTATTPQYPSKKMQEKKALEKNLASCLKNGHSVENDQAIVSEFLRRQKK